MCLPNSPEPFAALEKQLAVSHQTHYPLSFEEATVDEQRLSSYRFVIGGLAILLGLSFGLSFFAISPITPLIIEEYGINHSTASLLTSLVSLSHVLFAIPGSMLLGRVGLKKLILLGWVLVSAPILTFLAESFLVLLALRVLYGVGFALIFPAMGPLAMQWFRSKELPLANGLFLAVASLGIAISTFIVAPMAEAIGWKVALSLFGGLSLIGALSWLMLGRAQTLKGAGEAESPPSIKGIWDVLRSRTTLLLAVADAGPFALLTAAVAWLPTFYHEVHGMSLARAGFLMGILSITGFVSLVLASLLSLRVARRRPFLIIPGFLVGFAGFGSFLLADSVAVYVAVVALGFACWFYLPILMTIPMELPETDSKRVSLIFASIMTLGSVMTFLSPLVVGATTDLLGSYLPGFAIFSVLAWSLGVSGILLPETGTVVREQA